MVMVDRLDGWLTSWLYKQLVNWMTELQENNEPGTIKSSTLKHNLNDFKLNTY